MPSAQLEVVHLRHFQLLEESQDALRGKFQRRRMIDQFPMNQPDEEAACPHKKDFLVRTRCPLAHGLAIRWKKLLPSSRFVQRADGTYLPILMVAGLLIAQIAHFDFESGHRHLAPCYHHLLD